MYNSISVLEVRQDEMFDRIVRRLGEAANVDVDDAMIWGFVAEAAEALVGLRPDQTSGSAIVLEGDPMLAELVSAYDDIGRTIADLLAGDSENEWGSEDGLGEVADLKIGLIGSRDWSDDR